MSTAAVAGDFMTTGVTAPKRIWAPWCHGYPNLFTLYGPNTQRDHLD